MSYSGIYRADCVSVSGPTITAHVPSVFGTTTTVTITSRTGVLPVAGAGGWVEFEGGLTSSPVWVSASGASLPVWVSNAANYAPLPADIGSDGASPGGPAGGALAGTYPNPTVPGLASKADLVGSQVPTSQLPPLLAIGSTATTAVAGNDTRLTNTRTPTALTVVDASVSAGAAIAESKLDLATDAAANVGSRRTLGGLSTQAVAGNDTRLGNSRIPTSHAASHTFGGTDALAEGGPWVVVQRQGSAMTVPNSPAPAYPWTAMTGMGSIVDPGALFDNPTQQITSPRTGWWQVNTIISWDEQFGAMAGVAFRKNGSIVYHVNQLPTTSAYANIFSVMGGSRFFYIGSGEYIELVVRQTDTVSHPVRVQEWSARWIRS